jgi:PAS domain S-box-containing protein
MLDIKTIIILSIFGAFLMGLGLFAVSGRMSNQRTIRLWAYGNFLQGTGWLVLGALRGIIPDVYSIIIGQMMILASLTIWSISLSKLLNLKIIKNQFIILGTLEFLSLINYTIFDPSIRMRIIIISSCTGYLILHLALRLFRSQNLNPFVYKFNGFFYLFCGVILWIRAIYHIVFEPEMESVFSNSLPIEQLSYFVFFCTSLMSPFGFLLITNDEHTRNLRKFKEQIQLLSIGIEQSPISIVITNLKGEIEYINPTFTAITGYTFAEVFKKNPRILKSGNTSENEYKEMWKVLTSGNVWKGTFKNINKNGEEYWESATISPIKNNDGAIINYIGVKENITKQIEMQEALVTTELKIKNIVNSSSDIVYTLDGDGKVSGVYGDWIERRSKEKEYFIGKTTSEILSGSNNEHESHVQKALAGERVVYIWESKKDSTSLFYQTALTPWIVNGSQIGVLGVGRDITELNRIEKALRDNEKKLLTIFNTIEIGISITDEEGNIIDSNQASEKILGVPKSEHITRNYAGTEWKILRSDMTPMPPEEFASVIALKENRPVTDVEMGILKENSNITWIRVSASPMNLPGYGVVVSYVDITSKKQAELILKDSETKFKNFFKNNKSIFVFINPETLQILDANDSAVVFYQYSLSELKEKKMSELSELPEVDLKRELDKAVSSEQNYFIFKHKLATGELRDVEMFPSPFEIDGKKILFSVINDITERTKLELNKVQSIEFLKMAKEEAEKANRLKSEFLAHMSHDIRTPMNSVIGFTEIIKDKLGSDSDVNSELEAIQKSGKTLISLLNDILDLARIEAGLMEMKLASVNIVNIIQDVVEIFSSQTKLKNLFFNLNISKSIPEYYLLDELRIRQILLNLIGNAIKFTEKGSITINLYGIQREPQLFDLEIEIIDTGIGIPKEDYGRIFEPFIQRKFQDSKRYGGSGLGLSITRRLVELMNGEIYLESELNVGTKFTVRLSDIKSTNQMEIKRNLATWQSIVFSKSRILLVEDIEENRNVVKGFLRKTDLEIIEVENGKQAIQKLEHELFDLILMDIQMPIMDGKEASSIIKSDQRWKDIPILILSADAMQDDIEDYKKYSDGYIAKPIEKQVLFDTLSMYLPNKIND